MIADIARAVPVIALSAKTGKIKWKTYTVPKGMDGGAVWSTPAIDRDRRRLYVGTGNAYHAPAAATTAPPPRGSAPTRATTSPSGWSSPTRCARSWSVTG